jgi:hypothetical protein
LFELALTIPVKSRVANKRHHSSGAHTLKNFSSSERLRNLGRLRFGTRNLSTISAGLVERRF